MNLLPKSSISKLFLATFTALMSAIGASLCCIAPLIYLLFGISSAWLVSLHQLSFLQYPLLIISLLTFAYGGWLLFFSHKILCTKYISRLGLQIGYLVVFILLLFLLSYPYILPWLLGGSE
ncbi:hypothetical protein [Volucribacter psittacicida]|nr:hypothetical protein [Volucribacter psittacicida]